MRIVFALVVVLGACDHDTEPAVAPTPVAQPVVHVAAPERPVLPPPAATADDTDTEGVADDDDSTEVQVVADAKPVIIDLSHDVELVIVDRDVDDVPDVEDRCPDAPENNEGYEDVDGCPDPAPP